MVKIALGTVTAFIGLFFLQWNGSVEDAGTPATQTWQYAIPFFVVSLVLLLLGVRSVHGRGEDSTKLLAGIGIGFVMVVVLLAATHSSL